MTRLARAGAKLLLCALAAAVLPGAAAAGQAGPAAVEAQPDALRLAQLMAPTDLMTASELREFDLHFKKAVLAGKTEAEADGEYPGLTDAIVSAARPLVVTAMERSMPELHKAVARVVQERLTQPQTAELITFYESPTGQSIMQAMAASTDAGDIYKRAVEREGEPITGREIAAQSRKAAEKATKTLTKAQEAEMI